MIPLRQLRASRARPKAVARSVPAPVGGWNTRDSLDAMAQTDAITMDNWFPGLGKVTLRDGYEEFSSGVGAGNVDTVIEYHAGSTRKLLAASDSKLYDASSSTAVQIGTGYSTGTWQGVNFNGKVFLFNGSDNPLDWDGTTLTATGWTGTTISNLVGANVFKNRIFTWADNSQDFWYGGVNAVTGPLTNFPLSRVSKQGGNLIAMANWTYDGGDGSDDIAAFIMSTGEVIVYQGSDPGSSTDWALVGIYQIGIPLGRRAVIKVAGDILVCTKDDYVSMSQVLKSGQMGNASKISGAVQDASSVVSDLWQAVLHRNGNLILVNVPTSQGDFQQHVMNASTGAWCRYVDIPARAWTTYNGQLLFGSTDGKIYKMTGNDDNGSAIQGDVKQAWDAFGTPNRKRVSAIRPVFSSEGTISYNIGLGFDFEDVSTPNPTSTSASGPLWDVAIWDVAEWAVEQQIDVGWRVAGGTGENVSPRIKVAGMQAISWLRTDYRIETGINL